MVEEESCRRNPEGGILEGKSRRRNHGRGILEEESWRRNHGEGILEEESSRRSPGGGIREEESWSWRRRLEAPKRHPGGTLEGPRIHPGGTQRHPGGTQGSPRRPEASERQNGPKPLCFFQQKLRDRPFRVAFEGVTLTISAACAQKLVAARPRGIEGPPPGPYTRPWEPLQPRAVWGKHTLREKELKQQTGGQSLPDSVPIEKLKIFILWTHD